MNRSMNAFVITGGSQLSLPIYHLCFMLLSNLVSDPGYSSGLGIDYTCTAALLNSVVLLTVTL